MQNQKEDLTVAVVVCCYTIERWAFIEAAIKSAEMQTRLPDQIILVVDYNDALFSKAKQQFKHIDVIKNSDKKGLSGTRNTALRFAGTDIIAFLDDDAYAHDTWLSFLLEPFSNTQVLATGGKTLANWELAEPKWLPKEFYWTFGCDYLGGPNTYSEVRNLFGCNMALRRQPVVAIGGFNTDLGRILSFPLGGEETELCLRLKASYPNSLLYYLPQAQINHFVSKSRTSLGYFVKRCFAEGLSKAKISALIASNHSLQSERSYALKVLPEGLLRGLKEFLDGNIFGLLRCLAILIGFSSTVIGFGLGHIVQFFKKDTQKLPSLKQTS